VTFSAADRLALSLGLEGDSARRVEAGLVFELTHNLSNGHTFLPRRKLLTAAAQLLDVEGEPLSEGLDALIHRGEVTQEEVAGETACYLSYLYESECYVAHRLTEMSAVEFTPPRGIRKLIDGIGREQGIVYAPRQREAVELAARCQVMLLTGGPGMGKTTSLRGVLALFEQMGLETALCAPTGRAAKRLGDACGVEASTIHRLLETQFDQVTGRLVFAHDESDPIKADAVIVDETSMVDLVLMRALLAALRGDCRLILVGDPDQLPSVGAGNVLSDLLRSGVLPTICLTEIFRQAAESAIVTNAYQVNQGSLPSLQNGQGDFFFLRRGEADRAVETIVELCKTRLPQHMGISADQIQVLSPTRKHMAGTAALNRALQEALNPPTEGKNERRFGNTAFREGDRVMQVKNNYDMMWQEKNSLRTGMGIFNGDIGTIVAIDPRQDMITVDFDGRLAEYPPELLGELEVAYAVTVHKAQGSEYRAVVFAAVDAAPMLLTRGVLYTAITRARALFIAVGTEDVLARMTANNRQRRRYSGLRARLAGPIS
jgi:exodeoxyribonuclease V alpha subunit